MLALLANWKTTVLGVAAALTATGHLLNALISGDTAALATDVPAILAGLGLIFGSDAAK